MDRRRHALVEHSDDAARRMGCQPSAQQARRAWSKPIMSHELLPTGQIINLPTGGAFTLPATIADRPFPK
jgi:hypothetical protein